MKMKVTAKLTAALLIAGMCLGTFSSCKPKGGVGTPAGSLILGEMLPLTAVNNDAAGALVDNSGMSGLEASNHLAGTDPADMYVFNGNETVIFELNRAESLGQFYIWNYGESGKTDCGVKEINIQYSVDGQTWTDFGTVTLSQAPQSEIDEYGGCVAADYDEPINFGGVPAKYISLTPVSNYGGASTGLAEIRVFRHKLRPGKGYMITGETVVATVGNTPEAAFNNQGMSDLDSKKATHNANPADMWLSEESIDKSFYVMSLDGSYPVSEISIWNYNDPANLGSGIKEFEVYYTLEQPCDIIETTSGMGDSEVVTDQEFDFSRGTWTKLTIDGNSVFTLPQGTGEDGLAAGITLEIPVPEAEGDKGTYMTTQMQHIKIVPLSNYGGSGYGLSEVRVFAGSGWGVEPARNWAGLMSSSGTFDYQGEAYNRNGGWVGADGIHAYNMNGGQQPGSLNEDSVTFVLFQDTVVANMNNYKGFDPVNGYDASHSGWVNMSYLVIEGDEPDVRNIQFILQGKDSDQHPYNNICAKHYWMGDITLIDGKLYNIATKYQGWDTPEGPEGTDIVTITMTDELWPDMNVVPEVVYEQTYDWACGALFENTEEAGAPDPDGYIYIYSRKAKNSKFLVSRCKPEDYVNYDNWEFWDGDNWIVGDPTALEDVKAPVSKYAIGNESGVCYSPSGPFAGKYLNLYTVGSVNGQLHIGVSSSLVGDFVDLGPVMWATEKYEYTLERGYDAVRQWNYNAKIHPSLSKEGELLITYHIGTQQAYSNTMALEYVHPVCYNMFQIA